MARKISAGKISPRAQGLAQKASAEIRARMVKPTLIRPKKPTLIKQVPWPEGPPGTSVPGVMVTPQERKKIQARQTPPRVKPIVKPIPGAIKPMLPKPGFKPVKPKGITKVVISGRPPLLKSLQSTARNAMTKARRGR